MLKFFSRMFGTKNERELKKVQPMVDHINGMESKFVAMSDDELKSMTGRFREKLDNGASLDDILPAAFATAREAGKRVLQKRHYDVQLIGGMILHSGRIAEMKTGEGKTLVATLPCYLNGLTGKGVHLITVNDYLASRDAEEMGRLYRWLGLTSGCIINDMNDGERQAAYGCDITYGTNNEFGFDYLRDNMKYSLDRKVQRGWNFAIIDEVDSILVDEARTPLIISGKADQSTELYYEINRVVPFLLKDQDYIVDEEHHSVTLTDEGVERVEEHLKVPNLYEPQNIEYLHHVNKALQAHTLYKKDVRYIVDDGKVVIVDEHTGRPMPGRRWSDGLHQAVEAKEGVKVLEENQTLATVTFQNFFRMYDKLAGMTGTAETEAEEFKEIYKLDVVVVPTNRPIARNDYNDVIYKSEREKFKAVVDQIEISHKKGQPVLVGTVSVEKSDALSKVLTRKKIKHSVLNAKFHRDEAEIVSQAGRLNGVTIATNMAGRGTDIMLGGNAEALALKIADEGTPEFDTAYEKYSAQCAAEKEKVLEAGGLFIIGTERHESRRIDNQLRGRAGRQGDPGASRFYLSLEDDLLRIFNAERIKFIMEKLDMPEGEPIESSMVTKALENAQKRVEGRNFDIRKNLLEYDDVMNAQRKAIYVLRDKVLAGGKALWEPVLDVFERAALNLIDQYCSDNVRSEEWDKDGLARKLKDLTGVEIDLEGAGSRTAIEERVWSSIEEMLKDKEGALEAVAQETNARFEGVDDYEEKTGKDILVELMQNTYLKAIDQQWREHLKQMDGLRDAIRFQGYAQKDPKKVYKIEGFEEFSRTMNRIDTTVAEFVAKVQVEHEDQISQMGPIQVQAAPNVQIPTGPAKAPGQSSMPVAMTDVVEAVYDDEEEEESDAVALAAPPKISKFGRNDPCPCGSGKKFKKCHMGNEGALAAFL